MKTTFTCDYCASVTTAIKHHHAIYEGYDLCEKCWKRAKEEVKGNPYFEKSSNTTKPTQEQLDLFVRNNIGICQSSLVDDLLYNDQIGQFDWEQVVNGIGYRCDECSNTFTEKEVATVNEEGEGLCPACEPNKDNSSTLENDQVEVLEWWTVDDWMKDKLIEQGEAVLVNDYGNWWGRACSGQAIFLDPVIERIYSSLNS